jgi:hypothetical protein
MGFLSKVFSKGESDDELFAEAAALVPDETEVPPTPEDDSEVAESADPDSSSEEGDGGDPLAEAESDPADSDDDDGIDLMDIFEEEATVADANVKKLGSAVGDSDLGELMEEMQEVLNLWQGRVA